MQADREGEREDENGIKTRKIRVKKEDYKN